MYNQNFTSQLPRLLRRAWISLVTLLLFGGATGWYARDWLWRVRGFIDLLVGGVGVRRGRRDPEQLRVGDTVDWWRVESYEPDRLLRLRAEMKLPGRAWLQYEAVKVDDSQTLLTQTAFFASKGLFGLLYWYLLYPMHGLIFSGMIRALLPDAATSRTTQYRKARLDSSLFQN